MPIKYIHKPLASINEKTFFYINFSSIVTQTKKQKLLCSISTLYVELISTLVNACILTMILTSAFLYMHTIRY